jgi:hypothetical protein
MHYKICTINYSRICRFYLLSKIFYFIQFILLKLNLSNHYYIDSSNRLLINRILKIISRKYDQVIIKSPNVGYNLKKITIKKILSFDTKTRIIINNEEGYENIMWSILFADSIDLNTIKSIKKQIKINLLESF